MTDNNPPGLKENGNRGDQSAAKEHDIAAAINSLEAKYEAAEQHQSDHEHKVFLWTRGAALGVFFYTALTVVIAGASVWQGWVARDTEIIANRAIVFSNSIKFFTYDPPVADDGKRGTGPRNWSVSARIENVGGTPTRNARVAIGYQIRLRDVDDAAFEEFIASKPVAGKIFIGPRSETPYSGLNLTEVDVPPNIGVLGVVKYQDIFGYPHIGEFCYSAFIFPPINFRLAPAAQPINFSGAQCTHHNCADEECGSDWKKRALE